MADAQNEATRDPNAQTRGDAAQDPNRNTLLIAHVTAHLLDESSFELYPFVDADDVKSKVSELCEGWARSGFLLRGSRLIPWHRVARLEATSVEEITRQEAQQRLLNWQAEDQRQAVQNFWKTKNPKGDKDDGGEEGGEADGDKDVKGDSQADA